MLARSSTYIVVFRLASKDNIITGRRLTAGGDDLCEIAEHKFHLEPTVGTFREHTLWHFTYHTVPS